MKINFLLVLISFSFKLFGQSNVYINEEHSAFKIGNQFIERTITIIDNRPGTTEIINKLSGMNYSLSSNEFSLNVVFAGFGPALGKNQNGENPSSITSNNFHYNGFNILTGENSKTLILKYSLNGYLYSFNLDLYYQIVENEPYIKKWIEITDSSEGIQFLDRLNVEDFRFSNPKFSHGEFGQPVFNNDIFLAVEYPAVENFISENQIKIGYALGKKITKDKIISFPSIIGVSPSDTKLEQTFMSYVDSIKVKGTRPFLLYNSWYDLRNPAIAEGSESIMNEKNVLERIESFKKYMVEKHKITLDAFVLDDGWDNYNSIWEVDTRHLPNKFTPFISPLKAMHTSLGIWASPFCGYSNRDKRVKWGSEHGYEKIGDFLCFAGKNYKAQFEKKMVEYTKDFNMGYFKWDGFLLACNELDHGHLPGVFSREELISTYIHMMQAVRKINPDIFINITVGSWLSPWWLQYSDCIWMQGEDYAYAEDVPSMNPRDKAVTYRDAVLWDNFQNQKLLFPMSSLMTHGIIKGRLNFLGGKNEPLDSFTNEVMMYFGRGVMMWELYVSPDLLSDAEWDAIANSLKWAKANKDVLSKTKMILGNPLKREPYGYTHLTKEKGIVLLRNSFIEPREVEVKLDQTIGEMDIEKEYFVKIVYPYNKVLPEKFRFPGKLSIKLNGYEILLCELIPVDKIPLNTPIGARFDINEKNNIILYDEVGAQIGYTLYPQTEKKFVKLDGKTDSISVMGFKNIAVDGNNLNGNFSVTVPYNYLNAKLSFLIEPKGRLLKENLPSLKISINGLPVESIIEQENGRWFWMTAAIQGGEDEIDFKLEFKEKCESKISLWLMADQVLGAALLNEKLNIGAELLPPKPYASEIKKIEQNIITYSIK